MFTSKGITWDVISGEAIDVHGVRMVRLPHGTIVAATNWRESRSEAMVAAADRVEALAKRLLDQSKQIRVEASRLQEEKS